MKSWIEKGYHEIKGGGFMNKEWDSFVPQPILWKEIFRVLKPGGHCLAFSSTRTQDWLSMALRFSGFEIRNTLGWIYGSGMPKGKNISKAIDKKYGIEREKVLCRSNLHKNKNMNDDGWKNINQEEVYIESEKPVSKEAIEWDGWNTGLRPAFEPIIMARKPLSEKTIEDNVLKWGTGGINIGDCRIFTEDKIQSIYSGAKGNKQAKYGEGTVYGDSDKYLYTMDEKGRFPTNIIIDDSPEVLELFPYSKSGSKSHKEKTNRKLDAQGNYQSPHGVYGKYKPKTTEHLGSEGSAARFFYCAKISKSERNAGLIDFKAKQIFGNGGGAYQRLSGSKYPAQNFHPTVKPYRLMAWLCKLVTPKNGLIYDPFMGSGSTGIAAVMSDFRFIGSELDDDYFKIAESRIKWWYNRYKKIN